ncbi:MAG TPA: tripartite tricarboxylate transporter substrate binding protein [Thermodesulfobacteriota bacterium]|nr:tripartite tricarboxylate transporter substrate binding protein [Thermodesulfobacteriota bacterium]
MRMRWWSGLGLLLAGFTASVAAAAPAAYPTQPVRLVITHAAGGTTDLAARLIHPYLQRALGVPVVIENMPGAGGNLARSYVFKQPPDGYTLLVSQQPSMSSGQLVTKGSFDTLKFVHVYNIAGRNYNCVAVGADSPIKTIEDLRRASAREPLTSAGTGIGSNAYVLAMLLQARAGVKLTYVPFNSGGQAALAVAGGQTQMGTGALDSYWPLHEQKKLRIIAVSGPERDPSHPELPTIAEQGFPDIVLDQLTGVFAPPGLPEDRLKVLVAAFQKAFEDKEFQAAAAKAKLTLQPMGPAEFTQASTKLFKLMQELAPILKPE